MKVTREKTENCQVFLSVEMEPADVADALDKSYHRLAKKASVPGFRKGKAPRAILEGHIGKERLFQEALNELVPQSYEQAVKEQEIEAFAQPEIEVTQTEPLVFKATVPLRPTVTLGDYHGIRVEPEKVETTAEDVRAMIEKLRRQHATWDPVERAVGFDDLVVMNVEGYVESEPFVSQDGAQYEVRREASFPVPGFAEQLAGMNKDEEKEFKLPVPDDYPKPELVGKELSFKVKVTEVKEEKLPELNDELAKQISPDAETLEVLREKVTTEMQQRAEEKSRVEFEDKVIAALVEVAQVEFPPVVVEVEVERMIREQTQRLQMSGQGLEEYLASINKTEAELREELKPLATRRITNSLVLGKVAEEEKVTAGDADIDAEVEEMIKGSAQDQDKLRDYFNTPSSRESIKRVLLTRRTMQRLAEIAKGEE